MDYPFVGIDYGSKLAGTTVGVYLSVQTGWEILAPPKKADADAALFHWITQLPVGQIFIDAPLSLPLVYANPKVADDYFYRAADRQIQAMSPMFLGGLTARAMRLKRQLEAVNIATLEVYPGGLARHLGLAQWNYKQGWPADFHFWSTLQAQLPEPFPQELVHHWHGVDGLLAWVTGWRQQQGLAQAVGDPDEGLIWI